MNLVPTSPSSPIASRSNESIQWSHESPPRSQPVRKMTPATPGPRSLIHLNQDKTAEKILEIIENNAINGRPIMEVNGLRGEHSQIYEFAFDHTAKKSKMDGANQYVKIFHERCLEKHLYQADTLLKTMMEQNAELKTSGLRVVKVINEDTASDDKYLVVEKLAPVTFGWNSKTTMPLDKENQTRLDEVMAFFRWGAQNPSPIPLDIRPSNFGLRNGKLVLLDLMEHSECEPFGFKLHANRCAKEVAQGNVSIFQSIKKEVIAANPSYEQHF
ncbi:MAG: hypothetical protein NT065_00180 [Chlamydiae bacterium]|nr:hypothetical protein [Chlamydiota bacterium]